MKDKTKYWNKENTVHHFSNKPPAPDVVEFFSTQKTGKVLDLGCGAGRHSLWLAGNGFNITACDIHTEMIDATTKALNDKKLNGSIYKANMRNLPFNSSSFDFVISTGVLHNSNNVQEFQDALKEIARVLKPQGNFFFTIFTNDIISKELEETSDENIFFTADKLPMVLFPKSKIAEMNEAERLFLQTEFRHYETNVETGKRSVWSALFQKM